MVLQKPLLFILLLSSLSACSLYEKLTNDEPAVIESQQAIEAVDVAPAEKTPDSIATPDAPLLVKATEPAAVELVLDEKNQAAVKTMPGTDDESAEKITIQRDERIPEIEKPPVKQQELKPVVVIKEAPAKDIAVQKAVSQEVPSQEVSSQKVPSQKVSSQKAAPQKKAPLKVVSAKTETPQPENKTVQTMPRKTVTPGSLKGTLKGTLSFQNLNKKPANPEGAIINLVPQGEANQGASKKIHSIDMKNKTYLPGMLAVKKGDTLVFKNKDPIKHNVFSSSGDNTFDLGTYGFRVDKEQVFDSNGIVKVYCNIHPEMALFISVSEHNIAAITDKSGSFSFDGLTPGRYLLDIWHLRGSIKKMIDIKPGQQTIENITIDTTGYVPQPHLNKHGKPYKKKPPIFKDEFY